MAVNDSQKEKSALRRRRRWRQLLGAVVCLLVVIGLVSVVSGGVRLTATLFDDSELKAEYVLRLRNLVALDPVPFDSIEEANQNTLLNALIWSSISEDKDYERDEVGAMYLPTADIDTAAAELYGPDVHFTYQTFEDRGLTYQYVEEKQAYLLPITSVITDYYPQVEKIKREGDTVRVTVGYLSQFSSGTDFSPDMQYAPVKYQDYLFHRDGDKTYLYAVTESKMKPAASSSASASAPAVPGTAGGAGQYCRQPACRALVLFAKHIGRIRPGLLSASRLRVPEKVRPAPKKRGRALFLCSAL